MFRSLIFIACLVSTTLANAETLTLAPKYDAAGTNPDGSPYTGAVSIQILSDTTSRSNG
jgi:hypothetical protein